MAVESSYSAALSLSTAGWGDTLGEISTIPAGPPNGSADTVDALAVLGRFISANGSISKARADLEPGCPDLVINITDVLSAVSGFQGLDYPFAPTALAPCDSTCKSPRP